MRRTKVEFPLIRQCAGLRPPRQQVNCEASDIVILLNHHRKIHRLMKVNPSSLPRQRGPIVGLQANGFPLSRE